MKKLVPSLRKYSQNFSVKIREVFSISWIVLTETMEERNYREHRLIWANWIFKLYYDIFH